jgi:hypothetical protein
MPDIFMILNHCITISVVLTVKSRHSVLPNFWVLKTTSPASVLMSQPKRSEQFRETKINASDFHNNLNTAVFAGFDNSCPIE